jgi:hypothetical protein
MSVAVRSADIAGLIDRFFGPGTEDDPGAWDRSALSAALAVAGREADARPSDPDPAILRAALLLRLGRREPAWEVAAKAAHQAVAQSLSSTGAALLARLLAVLGETGRAARVAAHLVARHDFRDNFADATSIAETAWLLGDVATLRMIAAEEINRGLALSAREKPAAAMLETLGEANLTNALGDHQDAVLRLAGSRTVWLAVDLLDEEQWPPFVVTRIYLDADWAVAEELEDALIDRLHHLYTERGQAPGCYLGHLITSFMPVPLAISGVSQ